MTICARVGMCINVFVRERERERERERKRERARETTTHHGPHDCPSPKTDHRRPQEKGH